MQWEIYKRKFTHKAKSARFDEGYIERCLNYAENLHKQGVPIIYDIEHFSHLVGYDVSYLLRASNAQARFYRHFTIPKKNNTERSISEPLPSLKEVQRWILDNILDKLALSRFAKGFVKNRNIKENARFHRKQRYVLSLDIKNFFPSIKYKQVFHLFSSIGYCESVSTLLSNLCTLDNSLPQGAPTSPAISNLVCRRVDSRLSGFALKNKIRYTRYADDITFSGDFDPGRILRFTSKVLSESKFTVNKTKTRLMEQHQRQEVTGIVVNSKMQAPRELRKKLRQQIYYIKEFGLESHLKATNNKRANYLSHLKGLAGFVLFINNKDSDAKEAIDFLETFS